MNQKNYDYHFKVRIIRVLKSLHTTLNRKSINSFHSTSAKFYPGLVLVTIVIIVYLGSHASEACIEIICHKYFPLS